MMSGAEVNEHYIESYGALLRDSTMDPMFKSLALELPSITTMMQRQETIDVDSLFNAQEELKRVLAKRYFSELKEEIIALYTPSNTDIDGLSIGKRALKNRLLGILMSLGDESISQMCQEHYYEARSMSERLAALDLLENYAPELVHTPLADFYDRYKDQTLVMNKYFSVLASSRRNATLHRVIALQEDPAYDIKVPNLVRSLIGSFARNPVAFYDVSGEGFRFVADKVIEIDALNPQIASGLAGAFKNYGRLNIDQKTKMGIELERIKNHPNLSNNVYEIVTKILDIY
jgi:aminopeptidase N